MARLIIFFECLLLTTFALYSGASSESVEFSTLYTAAPGSTNGGCDQYMATLEDWFDEIYDLVDDAANSLILSTGYSANVYLQRLVLAYYGIGVDDGDIGDEAPVNLKSYNIIVSSFNQMINFLNNIPPEEGTVVKPLVFCDETWLELESPSSIALDNNGVQIKIGDVPQTIAQYFATDLVAAQGQPQPVPWWSAYLNDYIFTAADYGGAYCSSDPTRFAVTGDANGIPIITICPSAFTSTGGIATLGGLEVSDGDALQLFQPQSLTLLHETFHSLLGAAFLSVDEIYTSASCLALALPSGAGTPTAIINPDSYCYFALGVWYLNQDWDFSGGTATSIA